MSAETPNRLARTIATDHGNVHVEVNRRGCSGEWSKECEEALAAVVRALSDMSADGSLDKYTTKPAPSVTQLSTENNLTLETP